MGKGVFMSKSLAIAIGVLTVSSVCGVVAMLVVYRIQIGRNPPKPPPTLQTTTPIPTTPPASLRLPDHLIPESYEVFLQPYLYAELPDNITEQSFVFKGNSTVRLRCIKNSKSIFLHVRGLNVTDLRVTDIDFGKRLSVSHYEIHQNESNFLEIQLEDVLLGNGSRYELFTAFEGELLDDLSGFYVSRYTVKGKDDKEEVRFLATSQMQPTDARQVFPCFDEPALKAVFNITIIHRPETTAMSNTIGVPVIKIIDGEEWHVTTFNPTPVMSTYLLAFTVSDFMGKQDSPRSKITTYARGDAVKAGHADYAAQTTKKILEFYETTFGLRYPLDKLDQIAVPDFSAGAMENWGLISYQESGLLFEEDTSSNFDKEWVATIIAHELAHQWFGNLVTMRWWNDLWLNEGFATYMSYMGVEAADWNLKDLIVLKEIHSAFQVDSLNSSHPLSLPEGDVETYSDIIELFDGITYSKGAAVLRMLSTYIGEEEFMNAIKTYLRKFQYMNPVYKDLWKCLQEETNKDVEAFMSTWTEQMGYPVITITTQTGEISQEQFFLKQTEGHGIPWQVHIIFSQSDSQQVEDVLLKDKDPVLNPKFKVGKDEWILANINCTGFYRVNYDEENWNKLLMQLESNHHVIPVISRGQLIDDAFNLARAGRLNVTIGLSLTKFLTNDTEYIPWESALKNLDYFLLMFDRSEVYGPIKKYQRKLVKSLYEYFEAHNMNGTVPEKHTDQYNQVNAIKVACSNGLPECLSMATSLFRQHRNNTNLIHPNLRRAIYCSAIEAGDEDDWEFAWEEFQRATVAGEKDKLRYALSCTKEIWLLNRYLQYTLDPTKIKKMDVVSTVNYIAENVAGQPLAWDFVRGQWSYLTQEYGAGIISFNSLLDSVTKRFSTDFELEQLKQLQRELDEKDHEFATRTLEQVIERTEANIEWVTENKQIVLDWFNGELKNHRDF